MDVCADFALLKFPKIPRISRPIVITEKLDGTNASIHIGEDGSLRAGSRTRFITPEDDNFGFAAWAFANREDLLKLGPGAHYGEWWGCGIQRKYGLKEKRFSLFNVERWGDDARPACCHVVPVLATAPVFATDIIEQALEQLRTSGSLAAPGFMNPEGIVVHHSASNSLFKKTLEHDAEPKASRAITKP